MNNKDKLFSLISSLSRGEKLHFKRFAGRHLRKKNNSYIRLFDYINTQSKNGGYDEQSLKQHFRNEKFTKNFPVMKSYLYENILKSLGAVQKDNAPTMLRHAYILYSKGLNNQVIDEIAKAKRVAIQNEDYTTLMSILELEYNLYIRFDAKNRKKKLDRIQKEEEETLKKIANLNKYKYYLTKLPTFTSKEILIRNEKERERIKNFIENTPMLSGDMSLTKRAKFLYLMIKGMVNYNLGNYKDAYVFFQKQLLLIEATPSLRKSVDNYALILFDFIYMAFLLKKFEDVPVLLEKFETLLRSEGQRITKTAKFVAYFFYYQVKLELIIYTADFENCEEVLNKTENFINNSTIEYTEFPILIFCLATVYFAKGDYENALKCINRLSNEFTNNIMDVIVGAKILSIFIHYELQNIELLQYMVKSFYHFLLKSKKAYKFETILIRFIRKLPQIKSNADFIIQLKELKKQFESIRNDPFESRVFFEYFDYTAWVDSKIENITVIEALKKRMR